MEAEITLWLTKFGVSLGFAKASSGLLAKVNRKAKAECVLFPESLINFQALPEKKKKKPLCLLI